MTITEREHEIRRIAERFRGEWQVAMTAAVTCVPLGYGYGFREYSKQKALRHIDEHGPIGDVRKFVEGALRQYQEFLGLANA